ncbi:MAG: metallophosphoesterase [Betaproteobacteria bacterium]|nr:metallophosphoesterase [Betaproteobacteria bacterium]
MMRILLLATLVLLGSCATRTPGTYSFALIGDLQYTPFEERVFPKLIDALNAEDLAFVVHLGDIKSGGNSPCTDALYASRKADFERSAHPFILLPGDNDWVDCRRKSNNRGDPLERLAAFRRTFYPAPESLGVRKMRPERQSERGGEFAPYVENTMWEKGGVVFVALNIQASNDNVGFDAASDAEQRVRVRANIAWMKEAFQRAHRSNALGVVLFQQANPGFEEPADEVRASALKETIEAFEAEARGSPLPVIFAHGDTHTFRVDRPYRSPLDKRAIANVTRIEGYGSPHINWVRITIDPRAGASPFRIESGGFAPEVREDH